MDGENVERQCFVLYLLVGVADFQGKGLFPKCHGMQMLVPITSP